MDNSSLQQVVNRIPLLKYRYLGSFPSDYVPTFDNDPLAIKNTQPCNIPGEQWIMIANYRHKLRFTGFLNRPSFLKQQYEQMKPEPLQRHPSVGSFFTMNAAFHLLKFRHIEITAGHDA